MACKQEATVVRVDGFPSERPETQEKMSDGDKLTQHVENVVRTWALVKKDLVGNGVVFYMRLFSENPEVKSLFSFASNIDTEEVQHDNPGLRRQAKMLMSMIDYAIRCLGNLKDLVPKLKSLGKRHFVKYNVKPEHFKAVGAALLWTLKEGLGEIFTRDVDAAWTAIFRILADVMIEGGKEGLAELKSRSTGDE